MPIPVIHFLAPTEIGDFAQGLYYASGGNFYTCQLQTRHQAIKSRKGIGSSTQNAAADSYQHALRLWLQKR